MIFFGIKTVSACPKIERYLTISKGKCPVQYEGVHFNERKYKPAIK